MLTAVMIKLSRCPETEIPEFQWTNQPNLLAFLGEVAKFNGLDKDNFNWIAELVIPYCDGTFDYDEEDMVSLFARDPRITNLKGLLIFGFNQREERAVNYVVNGTTLASFPLPRRQRR